MDKLVSFQVNDTRKLFKLSKKLNETKFFKNFLNESQSKLLSYLIGLDNFTIWGNFIEGNVYFKVSSTSEPNDSSHLNDDIDVDIDIEDGSRTAKRMASHIRYLLYEKAIDFYYFSKNLDESSNAIDEVNDDYDLLDSLNTESRADASNEQQKEVEKPVVREEDDDYDDDDDDDDGEAQAQDNESSKMNVDTDNENIQFNEENQLILEVPSSIFAKDEQTSESAEDQQESNSENLEDQENLIKEFNKVYHNFEYDRETLIKRRRLEKSDMKLEKTSAPENKNDQSTTYSNSNDSGSGIEFAFATGSSLKHLLGTIQAKRDQIPLNDYELRTLFMDVKKNRGKWANDDRVGQEELYDACEKVILELRSYTEHSTPFLNKVSKREAPNYGLIIKTPMDLNTVMKKLKNLQYNSKQEFVDDIMLIWSNCLLYNSDPKHFLRAHAIAMQKKSLKLIPHIPNIVIKLRSEIERDEEKDDINNDTSKGKSSKKGRKRTRNNDVKLEHESTAGSPESAVETPVEDEKDETPILVEPTPVPEVQTSATTAVTTAPVEEEEEEEENDEINEENNTNNNQNEDDEGDPELQAWKTLTAKSRAHYCSARAELFHEDDKFKLNFDAPAILREPNEMANFNEYITNKQVVSKGNLLENDEPYLLEYDITGGLPGLVFKGVDNQEQERHEQKIVDSYIANKMEQSSSQFVLSTENGLNSVYLKNITEMQEIRRICFKISLVRQMQTQQFVHHTQMRQPEIEKIKEVDLDPISKLENHEEFDKEIQYSVLRRNVAKMIMQTGFESAEPFAVNTLTQLAERYLSNLVNSVKSHSETISKNRLPKSEVLLVSLIENGVNKPDDLYTFVNERLLTQYNKLIDLRAKLSNFLKELLRPGLENFNEKSFNDNSDQFMTGDFSNDLGDDFFGFKELGLDKEFHMLSSSIPVYLLHSRLRTSYASDGATSKSQKYDDLKDYKVNKLYGTDVDKQIGILRPFYHKLLEKSKAHFIKVQKKNGLSMELPEISKLPLIDDEELPQKQRNIRPRLPPTGKITSIKKRPLASSFFLPELEELKVTKQEQNDDISQHEDMAAIPLMSDDPFNDDIDAKEIELMMSNLEE
ncbi:hypothetical protein CANTEDRAFT_117718 [Yamadazyma tenuis ATCC 10573]|uniref:SAGA complex subunit Spt7 n=1 Tax=Candida tenuis (strain ATCC 10573 / BCRC 21748 / CBS 615 / JCM 9827 / NBRC 10315 / NRRL Y-1498 / VKM Y-70) TaxID=590646 RepID=G3AWU2_CANTC|nr:uncharacterized protein CANTEDRAFT_117718 [Yamadazyma tenuis ATCC 10573]XP_006684148.1 uncharacterized protein CANTEDRAFT_117718 [Yamadazyma tenuis ATCC 10573]EGV66889.1 hypothetical protein CANTEDRAFT_117718 [Yamadazyma tenuis ATCC 10573]EGV66890.1 hypothetical protein CANTEDRAFT_117718 [Yamadazyma tenuis ATCC 10573]